MRVAAIPWLLVTTVGGAATLVTFYLIIRGPFLGGQTLAPLALMGAVGVFIASIIVTAFGGSKLAKYYLL